MSKSWVVACVVAGVALSVSAGFGRACPAGGLCRGAVAHARWVIVRTP